MTRPLWIALGLWLFLAPSARADGLIVTIASKCLTAYHHLAVGSARKYDNQQVTARVREGEDLDITVGPRIGAGMAGVVYLLRDARTGLPNSRGRADLIVKLPHRLKGINVPNPIASSFQNAEVQIYRDIHRSLPRIEADPMFPKDPPWLAGTLPTVPIIDSVRTSKGTVITKPFVKGREIKDLQDELGFTTVAELPREMRESLESLYQMTQATFNEGVQVGANGKESGISLDLNPANLVWIDNPTSMKALNLKRPSFVFFEMGTFPGNYFHRNNISQEAYLDLVVRKGIEYNQP